MERTAPAQGDEMARWLHAERDPAVPLRGTAMVESYLELISSSARVTQEHEILLAVQVDARRVRDRGRGRPPAGIGGADRASRARHRGGRGDGPRRARPRPAGSALFRTAFDPYARGELAALEAADPGREGLAEADAWPLGTRESWDHHQTDGALHATYWIAAWPRIDVSPMFMDSLLGPSGTVRAVAVTFEPLAPERSTREVEAAITPGPRRP